MKATEASDDRSRALVVTAEALAARFKFDSLVMIGVDKSGQVTLGASGLEGPDVMRLVNHVGASLARKMGIAKRAVMPEGENAKNYIPAGKCPVCNAAVHGPPNPPSDVQEYAAVCECGSFLIPNYNDGGKLCGVSLMTLEQVAALPDHVRISLMRLRKEGLCTGADGE